MPDPSWWPPPDSKRYGRESNEIAAVPKLLDLLMLEGTNVTVDAMNGLRDIAQRIIDKKSPKALSVANSTASDGTMTFLPN